MRGVVLFSMVLLSIVLSYAQTNTSSPIGADTVYFFKAGSGQNSGQDPAYFPANVLGYPDTTARVNIPSSTANNLCSIGNGGVITLGFKDRFIFDGPGTDFIVFENVMRLYNGKYFVEPGIVEVSKDNITYYAFPFDTVSLVGCAGISPTRGDMLAFIPDSCGGDQFDLSTIGIDSISYIRIKDTSNFLLTRPSHPLYNSLISGFDLDAVVAVNHSEKPSVRIENQNSNTHNISLSVYPNPLKDQANIRMSFASNGNIANTVRIQMFTMLGELVATLFDEAVSTQLLEIPINAGNYSSGVYLLRVTTNNSITSLKLSIVK